MRTNTFAAAAVTAAALLAPAVAQASPYENDHNHDYLRGSADLADGSYVYVETAFTTDDHVTLGTKFYRRHRGDPDPEMRDVSGRILCAYLHLDEAVVTIADKLPNRGRTKTVQRVFYVHATGPHGEPASVALLDTKPQDDPVQLRCGYNQGDDIPDHAGSPAVSGVIRIADN
jgi:hypothetical protein